MKHRSIRTPLALAATATLALGALMALDGGVLAAPRAWSRDGWTELLAERGAAAAAMTLLRYVALATSAYLLLLCLVTVLVRTTRLRWLDVALRFATPRILRPVLGIVTVATFAAPHAAGATDVASTPPVMVLVGSSEARTVTSTTAAPSRGAPTMRRVETPPPTSVTTTIAPTTTTTTTTTTSVPSATSTTAIAVAITLPPMVSTPAAKASTPTPPATWTIRRGEHLWHVADAALTERLDRAPSTAEITGYWQKLIDANRGRLADPENPDLVFVGQELVLPAA
jgi:hypothetical protein